MTNRRQASDNTDSWLANHESAKRAVAGCYDMSLCITASDIESLYWFTGDATIGRVSATIGLRRASVETETGFIKFGL